MNRSKKMKKTCAVLTAACLSIALAAGSAAPAYADSAVSKDETVYVTTDASGNRKETIVSDRLKGAGWVSEVSDVSELSDIENVKGEETFTQDGTNLTWTTAGNDIFYEGTTDKELPVGVSFTYYLDGKEMAPEDLAGKSGKLKIVIEYTNNTKVTADVGGTQTDMQSLFLMMSMLVLPDDTYSNVSVDNGRILDDGSRNIVTCFGFPGLKDTLGLETPEGRALKDKVTSSVNTSDSITSFADLPETAEITADVKDMTLDSIYTVALTSGIDSTDITADDLLGDANDLLDQLEDATMELVNGSTELSDGLDTLSSSYTELDSGIESLKNGIDSAAAGLGQYTDGVASVYSGAQQVSSGADELSSGSQTLESGIDSYISGVQQIENAITGEGGLQAGAQTLKEGINSLNASLSTNSEGVKGITGLITKIQATVNGTNSENPSMQTYISQITTDITSYKTDNLKERLQNAGLSDDEITSVYNAIDDTLINKLNTDVTNLQSALNTTTNQLSTLNTYVTGLFTQLQSGSSQLVTGASALTNGISQLVAGINTLQSNNTALQSGAASLSSGASSLASGAQSLEDGAAQLNSSSAALTSGVTQLQNGAGQLVSGSDNVIDGIAQLSSGAEELEEGMQQYNDEAIQPLIDTTGGALSDAELVSERLDAVFSDEVRYENYSGIADDMDGSVRFVFQTEAIGE